MPQEGDYILRAIEYAANFSSAQSNIVVTGPPTNPDGSIDWTAQLIIDFLYVTGDSNGSLQLKTNEFVNIAGYNFAFTANVPNSIVNQWLRSCPKGKGLAFSTTNGGNHDIIIKWHWSRGDTP